MGIYGALATAVSGLRAQSTALANISGNIANSQTTGYKRMETSFVDLIPDAAVNRQIPGAVMANSRATNDVRGDIVGSAIGTHIALNGSGFFVVGEKTGTSDGHSVFASTSYYTRRGDFELDRDGYLVNGAGYYLKGVPIRDGNVAGSVPGMIRVDNGLLPAKPTNRIEYVVNLPDQPISAPYNAPVDQTEFMEQTIDGGAITVYAENGASANMQLRWGKLAGTESWQAFYLSNAATDTWTPVPNGVATFNADGTLASTGSPAVAVPAGSSARFEMGNITVDGIAIDDVAIHFPAGALSQFHDANGTAKVNRIAQNGFPTGDFVSAFIDDNGRVVATYSNNEQIELFQVVTANFNAPNMLKRMDGGIYSATAQSGEAMVSLQGSISGGALETSNTDIAEEFTKLITTQQAYAAGTRIVSTSDEMLQEALNMVR